MKQLREKQFQRMLLIRVWTICTVSHSCCHLFRCDARCIDLNNQVVLKHCHKTKFMSVSPVVDTIHNQHLEWFCNFMYGCEYLPGKAGMLAGMNYILTRHFYFCFHNEWQPQRRCNAKMQHNCCYVIFNTTSVSCRECRLQFVYLM